jgi:hypothetical protein
MDELNLTRSLGFDGVDLGHFEVVLFRLVIATLLGASVAYRWWRKLMRDSTPPPRESAQAQTLVAVAGALMVAVIGNSTARAFGLLGLGAFIRFRSGIKDPRDAALMFVVIGIGMACGHGAIPIAVVATLFVSAVLVIFDAGPRAPVTPAQRAGILPIPKVMIEEKGDQHACFDGEGPGAEGGERRTARRGEVRVDPGGAGVGAGRLR